MALLDLIKTGQLRNKIGISEERLLPIIPILKLYIAFWREYPDLFVDFLLDGGDPTKEKLLKFFFYLRVFLRIAVRYRLVYAVFPRG